MNTLRSANWSMGGHLWGGADNEQAIRILRHALAIGINLIDTAPVYGFGLSEELIGTANRYCPGPALARHIALWGARRPEQLKGYEEAFGWHLTPEDLTPIARILASTIKDPIGPEFMAPPKR